MTIRDIQMALAKLGYLPGPIDGAWGRLTASAVRKFQQDHGLDADGIVGRVTLAALASAQGMAPTTDDPPRVWYAEAVRLRGVMEKRGAGSNPVILKWAGERGIPYKSDDIPWCGLFVDHCIASTLSFEPLPGAPLRARAWERFGIPTGPTIGAVLVFWRKSLQSGLGHVGFYAGEDEDAYCVLGGNQSDSVSLAWIAKNRLAAMRWPATVAPVAAKPVKLAQGNTKLSIAEA